MRDEKELIRKVLKSPFIPHPSSLIPSVGLLGLGNVARAFARYVQSADDARGINIRAVADHSGGIILETESEFERVIAHKQAGRSIRDFAPESAITDARAFITSLSPAGISTLIESLPTNLSNGQPALGLLTSALDRGINVVTVDKGPLVYGFDALKQAANACGTRFAFTGTTGVRIPDELQQEKVIEIEGVLNATTNYILTEMQERQVSFTDALATAQADGIAEPDPALDIEGWDTAVKVLILSRVLMQADCDIGDVSRIGIGPETDSLIQEARESNRVVRLVGRARIYQGRVRVGVTPEIVKADSPFFSVRGTSKAAVFKTESNRGVLSHARSGRDAISQTILEDVLKVIS